MANVFSSKKLDGSYKNLGTELIGAEPISLTVNIGPVYTPLDSFMLDTKEKQVT